MVRISQQLWRPLLSGQPCPGSTELSTNTAHVPCAPKASRIPTFPGWKQLQKLCQLHSDPTSQRCAPCLGTGTSRVDSFQIQVQLCKLPWAIY